MKNFNEFSINESNLFDNLTKEAMLLDYPVADEQIYIMANGLIKDRDGEIKDIYDMDSTIYDTFANSQRVLIVKLFDTGLSNVTPKGVLHSKKGVDISFNFRGYWNNKGEVKHTMNATVNNPGGLSIYDSIDVKEIYDIRGYMKSIIDSYAPNNTEDGTY
jgi:hypothetical protein